MEWWLTGADRKLLGPFTADALLKGIGTGKVAVDALVCEVGGASWKSIVDVAAFAPAFAQLRRARRFAEDRQDNLPRFRRSEPEGSPAAGVNEFDDSLEKTIADQSPLFTSDPPPALPADGYDDGDEGTVRERSPFRPSEPP